jgi:uncharacterized protein YbjT (DUF2867 family)
MTVLVTGASGTTGSRVAARLRHQGFDVRTAHRPRFDWADPSTFPAVLEGVDRCYLVPPTRDVDPAVAMPPFLALAKDLGVRRVVLLSSAVNAAGGPGAGRAHALIPTMFDEWAVLQPSWFMQNVTGAHHVAREIRATGTITTAAGDGRLAFVDADDIADVAEHALTDQTPPNDGLVLTGPASLSWDDVAALLGVRHVSVSMEALRQHLLTSGLPELTAGLMAYVDAVLVAGRDEPATDVVERLTGHPPTSFAAFVAAHR